MEIALQVVLVDVQTDSMMFKTKLNVNNVQSNVSLVITTVNVLLVPFTELIQKLVHVEMVCMKT
jgi:hypothetical protein